MVFNLHLSNRSSHQPHFLIGVLKQTLCFFPSVSVETVFCIQSCNKVTKLCLLIKVCVRILPYEFGESGPGIFACGVWASLRKSIDWNRNYWFISEHSIVCIAHFLGREIPIWISLLNHCLLALGRDHSRGWETWTISF